MNKNFNFRVNNFDFIRLIAALQVVFLHAVNHLKIPINELLLKVVSLFPGVPIFFVISGFLISASYERDKDIKNYFKNRFLRIYPGLWVCFFVSVLSVYIFYRPAPSLLDFVRWTIAQLSFFQFYNPDFLRGYGVGVLNGSLWTIAVELQFYIAIPFIYFFSLRGMHLNKLVFYFFSFLIFCMFVFLNYIYGHINFERSTILFKLFSVSLLPHLYMFVFGIFFRKFIMSFLYLIKDKFFIWLLLYLLLSFILDFMGFTVGGNKINFISFVVLCIVVFSFAFSFKGQFGEILKGEDISYGIYIYHMIIINVLVSFGFTGSCLYLLVTMMLTFCFAITSWLYVEKPALQMKKYSIRGRN